MKVEYRNIDVQELRANYGEWLIKIENTEVKREVIIISYCGGEVNKEAEQLVLDNLEYLEKNMYGEALFYEDIMSELRAWVYVMKNWTDKWSQSPYGDSYYSSKNISWGHKPEGSLRVSDHWNFEDEYGYKHCETTDGKLGQGWAVGKYVNGKYKIMEVF